MPASLLAKRQLASDPARVGGIPYDPIGSEIALAVRRLIGSLARRYGFPFRADYKLELTARFGRTARSHSVCSGRPTSRMVPLQTAT